MGVAKVAIVIYALVPLILMDGRLEQTRMDTATEREEILNHIHTIFQAYLRQDREAIREFHTVDWTGFQGPSVKIERGIDAYMVNAEKSLRNLKGIGYELLDTEVQIYGDLALVYYVARYDYRDGDGGEGSLPLRSIDVYRREQGKWNQCGSHITAIPAGGDWRERRTSAAGTTAPTEGTTPRRMTPIEHDALFEAREGVWRAWFEGDEEALRAALPPEAIAMDPSITEWADRQEILRRSSAFAVSGRLLRLEFPKTRIQIYGDVAILYTTFKFETEENGRRTVTTGRGTEIFLRREGRWLNTGWHLESGPEPRP